MEEEREQEEEREEEEEEDDFKIDAWQVVKAEEEQDQEEKDKEEPVLPDLNRTGTAKTSMGQKSLVVNPF